MSDSIEVVPIERAWFTPAQAADYSGFAVGTLANWRTQRNTGADPAAGPAFEKVGARIRYSRAALNDFIVEESKDEAAAA